jgi:hypothetical protein
MADLFDLSGFTQEEIPEEIELRDLDPSTVFKQFNESYLRPKTKSVRDLTFTKSGLRRYLSALVRFIPQEFVDDIRDHEDLKEIEAYLLHHTGIQSFIDGDQQRHLISFYRGAPPLLNKRVLVLTPELQAPNVEEEEEIGGIDPEIDDTHDRPTETGKTGLSFLSTLTLKSDEELSNVLLMHPELTDIIEKRINSLLITPKDDGGITLDEAQKHRSVLD